MRHLKTIIVLVALAVAAVGFSGQALAMGTRPPHPPAPDFTFEPPTNPYLADSPWPMTHRNPYCQASSPYPGPKKAEIDTDKDFNIGMPGLITMAFSPVYPNGERVIWGSSSTMVFKADKDLNYLAVVGKDDLSLSSVFDTGEMLSGAYTLVDRNNVFYMPRFTKIFAFRDKVQGSPSSAINVKGVFEIDPGMIVDAEEKIVGLSLTWDGMLAFATSHGLVGVVSRDFRRSFYHRFEPESPLEPQETISNSIACDEDGGIYAVTDKRMYRVQWTGNQLSIDSNLGGWSAEYEIGEQGGVRLGAGSGSTPSLMGTGGQDKFVVITDGKNLMNLVLFWRGAIPDDWKQIPGTKSRRIAAQVPVTFGNPDAENTLSEQSVCVRGYGALVVNNQLEFPLGTQAINILLSGVIINAPYGAEKFQWNPDPEIRTLDTAWVNKKVSFPNGIPCMSQATNMVYGVGQGILGGWTFEALDWATGKSVFSYRYGTGPFFNSAYAGMEIGLDSELYTGTLSGMAKMIP